MRKRSQSDLSTLSAYELAKYGHFEEFCRRASGGENLDLARVFERAVTDFRTVKRTAGHQQILEWCLDQGLDPAARAGWLNESIVCLAARYGNDQIVAAVARRGFPDDPFARAAVGDVDFLKDCASRCRLADLQDANGFNLLFPCAASGLGRSDQRAERRLADVCRLLLDQGVSPSREVAFELPIFPAFLCASAGGNGDVMRLLLDHDRLCTEHFQQTLEHALEPHQRSGEPFYHIAGILLRHGYDLNARSNRGRTLLHGSANRGARSAVHWLLAHGADPNALDDVGRTPLHVCAERNTSRTVLQMLVEAGSDPHAKDHSGKTPLDYARKNRRASLVAYLTALGAK